MTEDTDVGWLKKNPVGNPFRMSLRRSNRFYARDPDMDASLQVTDPGKPQMVVPFVPIRSNMSKEALKRMSFKIPTTLFERPAARKNSALPRQSMASSLRPPQQISRPSQGIARPQATEYRGNMQAPKSRKPLPNLSNQLKVPVFGPRKSVYIPLSSDRSKVQNPVERMQKIVESVQKSQQNNIISTRSVQGHSTPNIGAPRSILKQTQLSSCKSHNDSCTSQVLSKPRAAKRVNFDGVRRSLLQEKENTSKMKPAMAQTIGSHQINMDPLDESTIVFKNSFKPLSFESDNFVKPETVLAPDTISAPETSSKSEVQCSSLESVNCNNKKNKNNDNNPIASRVFENWKRYKHKLRSIHEEINTCDLNLQETLDDIPDYEKYCEELSKYKTKSDELYDKLFKLRETFMINARRESDIKTTFSKLMQQKLALQSSMEVLHEEFEKQIKTIWDFSDVSVNEQSESSAAEDTTENGQDKNKKRKRNPSLKTAPLKRRSTNGKTREQGNSVSKKRRKIA